MSEPQKERERIRRASENVSSESAKQWFDSERARIVAYEYLCHLEETRRYVGFTSA